MRSALALLLVLPLLACAPARFVCKSPGAPPAPEVIDLGKCFEQPPPAFPFENLAIEGGGAKGIAYGGALEVLHEAGITRPHALKRVAGTSAGSFTAALIALGYTPAEVRTLLLDLDLEKFEDDGAAGPVRLLEEFGWYSGEYFLSWLQCQVKNKTGNPDTTFQELHERNQGLGLPDLYVFTTDLTRSDWTVLSHETVPCMPVAVAARLSGSLPFFWNALRLDLDDYKFGPDGACRTPAAPALRRGGHVFSDGGVLFNYPLSFFDQARFIADAKPGQAIDLAAFGLHLDSPGPRPDLKISSFPDYTKSVVEAFLESQVDYFEHSPCEKARSVRIDDLGISTTEFNLTKKQKLELIRSGFDHTCRYLKGWSFEQVKAACGEATPTRTVEKRTE
jgi:NTE family protein